MALSEIDSFVEKFKHLWHAGIKASLNVESFDGVANLHLQQERKALISAISAYID